MPTDWRQSLDIHLTNDGYPHWGLTLQVLGIYCIATNIRSPVSQAAYVFDYSSNRFAFCAIDKLIVSRFRCNAAPNADICAVAGAKDSHNLFQRIRGRPGQRVWFRTAAGFCNRCRMHWVDELDRPLADTPGLRLTPVAVLENLTALQTHLTD